MGFKTNKHGDAYLEKEKGKSTENPSDNDGSAETVREEIKDSDSKNNEDE